MSETTLDGLYTLNISTDGVIDSANRISDGATVWAPNSDRYTNANPHTAEFLANNYDLSDRPALPSPSPPPSPDYATFRAEIMSSPAYLRIASVSLQTLAINTNLVSLFWQLGSNPAIATEIIAAWNSMVALTAILPSEVEELNAIATASNIRLELAVNGQMSII